MRTSEDRIDRLEVVLERLVEAQVRTGEQVGELAAAQTRTEERVGRLEAALERLAAAQTRTEERVGRLEAALERLAAAQVRTEERVGELAAVQRQTNLELADLVRGLDRLRKHVGGLSDTVGGDIEDIAYIVLHDVLKREFGWDVGVLERSWRVWDGETEEIDVLGAATDPAHPAKTIWVVGEAKHNLTVKDVERFTQLLGRARRNLTGEIFPVCFCYRARPEVVTEVQKAGLRLVYSYGKLV